MDIADLEVLQHLTLHYIYIYIYIYNYITLQYITLIADLEVQQPRVVRARGGLGGALLVARVAHEEQPALQPPSNGAARLRREEHVPRGDRAVLLELGLERRLLGLRGSRWHICSPAARYKHDGGGGHISACRGFSAYRGLSRDMR